MSLKIGDRVRRIFGSNHGYRAASSKYAVMNPGDEDIVIEATLDGVELSLKNFGSAHAAEYFALVESDWDK